MNPLTLEWIAKAGADLQTARREIRVRYPISLSRIICGKIRCKAGPVGIFANL